VLIENLRPRTGCSELNGMGVRIDIDILDGYSA
jgi:hypothetical protein